MMSASAMGMRWTHPRTLNPDGRGKKWMSKWDLSTYGQMAALGRLELGNVVHLKRGSQFVSSGVRWRKRERFDVCRCVSAGEKETSDEKTSSSSQQATTEKGVDPVGFLKDKTLKTKAFAQYSRDRLV